MTATATATVTATSYIDNFVQALTRYEASHGAEVSPILNPDKRAILDAATLRNNIIKVVDIYIAEKGVFIKPVDKEGTRLGVIIHTTAAHTLRLFISSEQLAQVSTPFIDVLDDFMAYEDGSNPTLLRFETHTTDSRALSWAIECLKAIGYIDSLVSYKQILDTATDPATGNTTNTEDIPF